MLFGGCPMKKFGRRRNCDQRSGGRGFWLKRLCGEPLCLGPQNRNVSTILHSSSISHLAPSPAHLFSTARIFSGVQIAVGASRSVLKYLVGRSSVVSSLSIMSLVVSYCICSASQASTYADLFTFCYCRGVWHLLLIIPIL